MTQEPDHPDEPTLRRIRELTRQINHLDGQEHEAQWRERAALLIGLQNPGLWHPVSLAAELGIPIGQLSDWELADDDELTGGSGC